MQPFPSSIRSRARYLHERLASATTTLPTSGTPSENFLFWKEVFAVGGNDLLGRRLESLNLSESQALIMAQDGILTDEEPEPPKWEETLLQALDALPDNVEGSDSCPFYELWLPLLGFARQKILQLPAASELLTPSAIDGLSISLFDDISELAASPTYLFFDAYRDSGGSFREFTSHLQASRCLPLFETFPSLARSLSQLLTTWIDTTTLFLARLEADYSVVLSIAKNQRPDSKIVQAKTGISDRHDGGNQVILLTWSDGSKILYKPKDLSLSQALASIDAWLRKEGCFPGWYFAKPLVRQQYGWEEYVGQRPCCDHEETVRYYRAAGQLLCLSYLLNAHDLWFENLVAVGDRPVPIDTETFFHPGASAPKDGSGADQPHSSSFRRPSVIETGLLPFWQLSASHKTADYSGLGGGVHELPGHKTIEWEGLNSDRMRPHEKIVPRPPGGNAVYLNGQLQDVRQYRDPLIEGFNELYHFILNRKNAFADLMQGLHGAATRLILRPTQLYAVLQKHARAAKNLTSGMRRSIVFEQLYRVPLRDGSLTPEMRRLTDFEVQSLLDLDIPRFYVKLDSTELRSRDFRTPGMLKQKPLDSVIGRIEAMSLEDLRFQIEIIDESLKRFPRPLSTSVDRSIAKPLVSEYVSQICDHLTVRDGDYLWALPSYFPKEITASQRLGLYLGDTGTLVFLAAAGRSLDSSSAQAAARFYDKVSQLRPEGDYPLGIGNGLGSLVYGCLLLGKFTGQEKWHSLALDLVKRASSETIDVHREPDILSGIAGFLLAAIRTYQMTGDSTASARAEAAYRRLLQSFDDETAWVRPDGKTYFGFAHGIAGIVFAITQYSTRFKTSDSAGIITRALAFDRQYYDSEQGAWPIAVQLGRSSGQPAYAHMTNWCNGSTGILLSRCAAWNLLRNGRFREEVLEVLSKTSRLEGMDHWCCGDFGIAETLIYIADQMDLPTAKAQALSLIEQSLSRALKNAFFRFEPSLGGNFCFSPSLFRGIAGIGYSLLRLAHPGALPNILAFEV
jgi:type 2 lantibiotic biosynthesis protein LanM